MKRMKPWQNCFTVDKWAHQLEPDSSWGRGQEGDWVESWTVLKNNPDGYAPGPPVTKRFYSSKKDAERGAAQIYNNIEKKLLL